MRETVWLTKFRVRIHGALGSKNGRVSVIDDKDRPEVETILKKRSAMMLKRGSNGSFLVPRKELAPISNSATPRARMNQYAVIDALSQWLREYLNDPLHVIQDHVGDDAQEPAIFIGEKRAGKGRGGRIKNPDIVVLDKRKMTTPLIVEVDPKAEPVVATGGLMLAMLGDNITQSNKFEAYSIQNALFVFVTILPAKAHSQKAKQFELIENEIPKKSELSKFGIAELRLCFGTTQDEAIERFKAAVGKHLGIGGPEIPHLTRKPRIDRKLR